MKKPLKVLVALACALALAAGTAVATNAITTKTLLAQYMGITLRVNGQAVIPEDANGGTVEPFVVDGTTYLPVRAVGEALGKEVSWDGETRTVSIQDPAPLLADAQQLIRTIESAHPAFALDQVPEGYAAARRALLDEAGSPNVSLLDFTAAAMAYTASLQDGHTSLDPFGGTAQSVLDVGWAADGEHLYLTDDKGGVTQAEVVKIGGKRVDDIFAQIDRYIPSENQSGRDRNHAGWARYQGLLSLLFGAQFNGDGSVTLTVEENGKQSQRTVCAVMPAGTDEPVISTRRMGDVFYVDFNQCVPGSEVDAAAKSLAQAVKDGTTKVIIDVRGNGGGDSSTCEQLLQAMGMQAPQYGVYVRYSPLAQAQRGYEQSGGGERYAPDPSTAKANPAVKLVVLTDEGTYSSATMLGVFVRDGGLGTIIGRASANAPNSYGDILSFTLSNSSAPCTVSHKQWLRPDENAQADALTPDLETAVGEDSLQTALAYLR